MNAQCAQLKNFNATTQAQKDLSAGIIRNARKFALTIVVTAVACLMDSVAMNSVWEAAQDLDLRIAWCVVMLSLRTDV